MKEFLKLFKFIASNGIHSITEWLDLLFKDLHEERKRRKKKIYKKGFHGYLELWSLSPYL